MKSARAEGAEDGLVPQDAPTTDAFHRGAFHLIQPRSGHRAGMDALVLAASLPAGFAGRLADFGAGAGAAGFAAAARCPKAEVTLFERAPEMAAFARKSLALAENAALTSRIRVAEADVLATGAARQAAGLGDRSFDFVIMNPPFNNAADRQSPDALRRAAHVAEPALFEGWLKSAAAALEAKGGLALIARPQSLPAVLAALGRRFGGAEIAPIHPRREKPAIRIVVRACKGSRAALSLLPPLVLHDDNGTLSQKAEKISNGRIGLFDA
jgi:tRNA1(Val) A37 N6-methylase TrmN6